MSTSTPDPATDDLHRPPNMSDVEYAQARGDFAAICMALDTIAAPASTDDVMYLARRFATIGRLRLLGAFEISARNAAELIAIKQRAVAAGDVDSVERAKRLLRRLATVGKFIVLSEGEIAGSAAN